MAKPKRDLSQVFGGLEDCHRAGVPQACGDTRFDEREAQCFFGRTDVLPEDVLKSGTSHTSVASIDK